MKRKMKAKLIVFLLAILSLFVFAGCSMGETLEEALETRNLGPQVTYYANGGQFENKKKVDIYYSVGAKALDIGNPDIAIVSGSVDTPTRANYELTGWYHVKKVVNEKDGLCELGEKVDFSAPLEEGDHWVVAAGWQALVGVKVVMACDDGVTVQGMTLGTGAKAVSLKNGDAIGELNYDNKDEIASDSTPDNIFFKVDNNAYTFVGYYTDKECTKQQTFPMKRGEEEITLYAKYVKGDWTLVKTTDDVADMFNALKDGAQGNYWIYEDIDCGSISVPAINTFGGAINGAGHTLSDLTVSKDLTKTDKTFGLFGNMTATAVLTDLTLKDVNVELSVARNVFAETYFVFLSKAAEATVSNVSLSGTMSISGTNPYVENIGNKGAAEYTHCLFGGYTTDEEYVTASNGAEFVLTQSAEEIVKFN